MAGDFVDDHEALTVGGTKLSFGIEKLDTVDGSVRGQIDVHLITQAYGSYLYPNRFAQPQIGNVSTGVIAQLHFSDLHRFPSKYLMMTLITSQSSSSRIANA